MHITQLEIQLAEDQCGVRLAEICSELRQIELELGQQLRQPDLASGDYLALEHQALACGAAEAVVRMLARRYHPSTE